MVVAAAREIVDGEVVFVGMRLPLMAHDPRRLRDRVDFVTSPGYGDGGPDWRRQQGLVRGGPSAVITTLGVLQFERLTGEAYLASYHPFTSPAAVQAATGWPLRLG